VYNIQAFVFTMQWYADTPAPFPTARDVVLGPWSLVAMDVKYLAGTLTGSIRTKRHVKFRSKGSMGVSRDCQNFWVPLLSQGEVKLQTAGTSKNFQGIHM